LKKIRIMFSQDDFKSRSWGKELEKAGCEIILNQKRRYKYLKIILMHPGVLWNCFINRRRVHVFIFRYLNDKKYLRVSLELLFRDVLTILVCLLTNTRIIWIMHNIDRETHEYFPSIIKVRRALVKYSSRKILVTDPNLIEYAIQCGVRREKLDWICFGVPLHLKPVERDIDLRNRIVEFKKNLYKTGFRNIVTGLCASTMAPKKTHYLHADSIVGKTGDDPGSCVVLILIGKFPEGDVFEAARRKAMESPYILFFDETFPVNEPSLTDQIDFFYRSLSDYSIAYSIYVASDLDKPVITHKIGALADLVQRENIGFVIPDNETDIPGFIFRSVRSGDMHSAGNFLATRSWEKGASKLLINIQQTGLHIS
jgi:glycosyltransferase involved in cell wall biosynthesis